MSYTNTCAQRKHSKRARRKGIPKRNQGHKPVYDSRHLPEERLTPWPNARKLSEDSSPCPDESVDSEGAVLAVCRSSEHGVPLFSARVVISAGSELAFTEKIRPQGS